MRKKISLIIILSLSLCFIDILKAQSCAQNFVEDVLTASQIKSEKFHKIVRTTILKDRSNDFSFNNVKALIIPVVFSTREGARISNVGKLNKEKLLCYLDGKSIVFDEALIVQDTVVLGAIIQSPNPAIDLEFIRDVDSYRVKLAKAILKTSPDIIFSIYNIPRCYWYIKGNELFVLSYEHRNNEMEDFMLYNAKSFIEEHLNEKDLWFLSHKRIIVISGK